MKHLLCIFLFPIVIFSKVHIQPVSDVLGIEITSFKSQYIVSSTINKLSTFNGHHPNTIIIDLRSNSGGFIHEAIGFAALFVTNNALITLIHHDGSPLLVTKPDHHPYIPANRLVILINSTTASAAEAAAHILQKHPNAITIGMTSYGKTTISSKSSPYRAFKLPNRNIRPTIHKNIPKSDDFELDTQHAIRIVKRHFETQLF